MSFPHHVAAQPGQGGNFPREDMNQRSQLSLAMSPPPIPFTTQQGAYENNGRLYEAFRRGTYMHPCDEAEQDRLDLMHRFYMIAKDDRFFTSHIDLAQPEPAILDIGCGTGIWCLGIKERFPSTLVRGLDLSFIQPSWKYPNLDWAQVDAESQWPPWIGDSSWDLIHIRSMLGSIHDWPALYSKIFRALKPSKGHVEHVELDMTPRTDNGELTADSPVSRWYRDFEEAMDRAGRPIRVIPGDVEHRLNSCGLVDIRQDVIKVPINPWHPEETQQLVGKYLLLCLWQGLEALSLMPFTRMLGRTREQVLAQVDQAKGDLSKISNRPYMMLYTWTARRPSQ